ncbi:MAG: Smr/MutS family protein [Pseudomonadota bacterium]
MATDDDEALFREAMQGVNQDRKSYRNVRKKVVSGVRGSKVGISERPVRASTAPQPQSKIDHTDLSRERVLFVRNKLSGKDTRRLQQGKIPVDDQIDLHGMNQRQAESYLQQFLHESINRGFRSVLIIHGKGHHSPQGSGILGPLTIQTLKDQVEVLAFCSATPQDGDTGALYVLLDT